MPAPASPSRRRLLAACLAVLLALPGIALGSASDETLLRRFSAAPFTVPRVRTPTRILLSVATIRDRLETAAGSPEPKLVLRLGGMRAAKPPNVVWRVYLGPPGTRASERGRYWIGSVALFGDGIGADRPARREFVVDAAVRRALRTARGTLELGFVPTGALVDGTPTTPRPAAALRVGAVSLWAETL